MAQAAENLNMSLRQAKRLSKSLRTFSARGLLGKKVGKASNPSSAHRIEGNSPVFDPGTLRRF